MMADDEPQYHLKLRRIEGAHAHQGMSVGFAGFGWVYLQPRTICCLIGGQWWEWVTNWPRVQVRCEGGGTLEQMFYTAPVRMSEAG